MGTASQQSVAIPRTGQQYSIRCGEYSAVITEVGAILRRFDYRGHEILVPFDADAPVPCCNGYLLVPFPNRLEDGEYTFEGKSYSLPIDERDRQTALHGLGYRYPWRLVSLTETAVTLAWRVPDLGGYPFDVTVTAHYALSEDGLTLTVAATNAGPEDAPWAFGMHPWLSNGKHGYGNEQIEADNAPCRLRLRARTHLISSKDRLLPVGEEPVKGTTYDLYNGPTLQGRTFDDGWTDVKRDSDGSTTAVFTRPDGVEVSVIGDQTIHAWQVCTGTGFPADAHPAGVAVEPMTAAANAFRNGRNLVTVKPGERYATTVQYRAREL